MAETIVLDPSEVATSRTQIDVTPWVSAEGIDWGDAEIAAYMADQARGSSPVDFRVPNRTITIPLVLKNVGGTTFAQARTKVQAKAAIFQREGGWIKRVAASGSLVFADVVNATLKLGGGWGQAHKGYDTDASLVLETLPDFYGAETTLADHIETSATEIVFTEATVLGDYPGRVRIVVDDDSGNSQLGALWSLRSRHYSSASTAATQYEAEALTLMDVAAAASLSGASGGTVVTHSTLMTDWTPVLNTNMGTAFLTHTGTNRLFARYRTTSGTAVQLRAVYDVGDMTFPVQNTGFRAQAGTAFYIGDLGEVRLDPSPVGVHRWQGQIQARGDLGTENVSIDKLWVLNVDEGFGKVTAPFRSTLGLTSYSARDGFDQSAGALSGKTLPVGGTWGGAGDADDFAVETTGKTAQRTAVSDAGVDTGRFAIAGASNFTNIGVRTDVTMTTNNTPAWIGGVLARYTSTTSWLAAVIHRYASGQVSFEVRMADGGASSLLEQQDIGAVFSGSTYTISLEVDTTGRFGAWFGVLGALTPPPLVTGQNAALATGGGVQTGKPGLYDAWYNVNASTRAYDGFVAYVPTPDAVVFASRSAQIATSGIRRLDATGSAYGPVADPGADLPRLPPSGLEGRPTQVFVKLSRGDFGSLPDTGIDDVSTRVIYQPSWLFVP